MAAPVHDLGRPMSGLSLQRPKPSRLAKNDVLCIEDDPIVQLMLDDIVGGAGANCVVVGSAREAETQLADSTYDLVLLDRRLPDSDGLLLMQTIKASSDCPVIILSAMDDTRDKLLGIGLGAAEYVTKPFNPMELSTRIRQLLSNNSDALDAQEAFESNNLAFNPRTRRLDIGGASSFLAPAEARLLHALFSCAGEAQTRDELSQFACGRDWSPGDRTIDVLVNRLRGRLQGSSVEIVTVHRTGYLLLPGPS